MSATHRWLGPGATKAGSTRSGAGSSAGSRCVVVTHVRRLEAKVISLPTPPAQRPKPLINRDLLDEARKDAFLLLIALDGFDRWGTCVHEEDEVQVGALRGLANVLSSS
jgi:hypothetical protein